jgi:predicted amidohydrolase
MTFRAACLQLTSSNEVAENIALVERLARQAASEGADYVQTPEMTNIVERKRAGLQAAIAPEESDPSVKAFSRLAAELKIVLHIGSLALDAGGGRIANRAFVFGPEGAVLARYDKIHLFDVDLPNGESWRESATYTPGEQAVAIDLPWTRLGVTICYDLRFPQLYRALAHAGAAVLTAPAAFTRQTGEAHWHVLQRARAIENGAFMISAAQGGRRGGAGGDRRRDRHVSCDRSPRAYPVLAERAPLRPARRSQDGAAQERVVIRYALICGDGHSFEAWFASSDAFAKQQKNGQLSCAVCGSAEIGKALMAPSLASGRKAEPTAGAAESGGGREEPSEAGGGEPETVPVAANTGKREEVVRLLRKLRQQVTESADYVGPRFAEEARKIHYGETDKRGIYGEASPQEARALAEEGIEFHPLPILPEDRN